MSKEPQDIELAKPKSWMEPTTAIEPDGRESPLPTYEHHLLCNSAGRFPAELNEWEDEVLALEQARPGFVAWYRNPARSSQDSLGVAYVENGEYKIVRPDFIVFSKNSDGSISASIVDPHGTQFADALPKLKGLAAYAESHGNAFQRVEVIAKFGGKLRVLDLMDKDVRAAAVRADDAQSLYQGKFAADFG
jgi:type III restriction enzyme